MILIVRIEQIARLDRRKRSENRVAQHDVGFGGSGDEIRQLVVICLRFGD